MNSKDIESASNQIKTENRHQLTSDSPQNVITKQTHSSQNANSNDKQSKSGQTSDPENKRSQNILKVRPKSNDCVVNLSIVEQPMGVFGDNNIRNGFIRKVYGILFVQIVFTTVVSTFMLYLDRLNADKIKANNDGVAQVVNVILLFVSLATIFAVSCIFCCSQSARRTVPINFILLGIFTIAQTYIVGFICAQNEGQHILIAFVITGVVVLAVTLLATTPWFDITNCGCLLCILFIIHIMMGFVLGVVSIALNVEMKPLYFALAIFGAFLFSLYLLYDTQLIMGGKSQEMSPEEYVFAALRLYIDIIQIFLHILEALRNS